MKHLNIKKFTERARREIRKMQKQAEPYSRNEYFLYAALEGLSALEEGNYGIGAVLVYRSHGTEYVIGGRNRMLSWNNTGFHAEEDVMNAFEGIAHQKKEYGDRLITKRTCKENGIRKILVTSLEPCIGCVQRILSHKLDEVWIGAEDVPSGAMLAGRGDGLPVLWKQIREKQNLRVILCRDILPELKKMLLNTFMTNREEFDRQMIQKGLSNMEMFEQEAIKLRAGNL